MNSKKEQTISFETKKTETKHYNNDKSMLLLLQYQSTMNPAKEIKYTVLNTKNNKIVKKGVFIGTHIEWADKNTLKCFKHIGMIKKPNDNLLLEKTTTQKNYQLIKID